MSANNRVSSDQEWRFFGRDKAALIAQACLTKQRFACDILFFWV
jgi:hypothetical protein